MIHSILDGVQYVLCIGISHGHMTMSHDHMVSLFGHVVCRIEKRHTTWLVLHSSITKYSSH